MSYRHRSDLGFFRELSRSPGTWPFLICPQYEHIPTKPCEFRGRRTIPVPNAKAVKILVLLLALFLLYVVPALSMACTGDGFTAEHMPPISGDMADGHPQSFPYGAERLPISIAGSGGGHVPDRLIPASAYFEDGDAIDCPLWSSGAASSCSPSGLSWPCSSESWPGKENGADLGPARGITVTWQIIDRKLDKVDI